MVIQSHSIFPVENINVLHNLPEQNFCIQEGVKKKLASKTTTIQSLGDCIPKLIMMKYGILGIKHLTMLIQLEWESRILTTVL